MSRRVGTPQNQVKLSSVNVVRLQRCGQRFEVACYPNKVVDYRSGVEVDLDEVLQIKNVFKNVSKGVVMPKKDLNKAFPKLSVDDVCREILRSGQLQVSAREREVGTGVRGGERRRLGDGFARVWTGSEDDARAVDGVDGGGVDARW